jgi:hypothetical protein
MKFRAALLGLQSQRNGRGGQCNHYWELTDWTTLFSRLIASAWSASTTQAARQRPPATIPCPQQGETVPLRKPNHRAMLKHHLNPHHSDFKKFAKIITPKAVATVAASLLGKVNCADTEAEQAIQDAINLLIMATGAVDKELGIK